MGCFCSLSQIGTHRTRFVFVLVEPIEGSEVAMDEQINVQMQSWSILTSHWNFGGALAT